MEWFLLHLLIVIAVIGLIYWITLQFALPPPFPAIIKVVLIFVVVLILLRFLLNLAGGASNYGLL